MAPSLHWSLVLPLGLLLSGVPQVHDGDSLRFGRMRVRLADVDAPELDQVCRDGAGAEYACGVRARAFLLERIAGRAVRCEPEGNEHTFGRVVARCYAGDEDLAAALVRAGWAVAYRRFGRTYEAAEAEARAARAGMWQGTFDRPWDWRRAHGPARRPGTP